jgi:hypothetical protein
MSCTSSRFGTMRIDKITTPVVARFRADLVAKKLGEKRINNILAVLSKPLKYAVECEVVDRRRASACSRSSGRRSSRGTSSSTLGDLEVEACLLQFGDRSTRVRRQVCFQITAIRIGGTLELTGT